MSNKSKKIMLSWSSGKDSAWTLYQLQQSPEYELMGLFTTVNAEYDRVAMHAVRVELLKLQAQAAGLPLEIINIPYPCSNQDYEQAMSVFVDKILAQGVTHVAFGDLFLQDIRDYRIAKLTPTGLRPVFPLWEQPTDELSQTMLASGLKAVITCIDPKQLSNQFCGREFNQRFLDELPESADPCGENGEFHSFVYDGPMFHNPVPINIGETVERDGFVFTDLTLKV